MNISIPEDQIQEVVSAAVLKHLSEEQRTAILESAVASLLKKPDERRRDRWGPDPKSPLQEAFERAAVQAADRVCREMIVEGPYREKVEAVAREALEKVFARREEMVEQVAKNFSAAIAAGMREAARQDDDFR